MGIRLISNEKVGIGAMIPLDPMLGFIYVDQGEDCTGEDISIRQITRDPRCGPSVVVLHTIVKSRRIRPHEMSRHHRVGSSK